MNHQYQTPFYQQQGYQTMNAHHSMALPQPIKLYNGKTNNLLSTSPLSTSNDFYYHQNNLSMLNKQQQYYQQPTFIQNSCETITPIYNQRYQHQPWKLGRTSNELMLSNEMVSPPSPPPYNYCSKESNGLSMDSTPLLLSNNNYSRSSPPLSVSSSTSTSYNYGSNYQGNNCSSNYNGLLYLSDSNHHYRRSSINTSRSSSPSTSSYGYQESVCRSPSPAASNKRYACQLCNKRFTRPSSLTTHIYSHTGEKPFKCPVNGCGRHFSVVSNLRRHAKVHGNVSLKSSSSSITAHSI